MKIKNASKKMLTSKQAIGRILDEHGDLLR